MYEVKRFVSLEEIGEMQSFPRFRKACDGAKSMMDDGAFAVVIMKDNQVVKVYRSAAWHDADARRYRHMVEEDQLMREMCE